MEEEAREAESAVKKLGGSMRETKTLVLPGTDVDRTFVPIDKINMTPKKISPQSGDAWKGAAEIKKAARDGSGT